MSRSRRILAYSVIATLLVFGITAVIANAAVTVTPATGGSTISADTTGGTYTSLTGPVISEGATADIGTGTIVLNVPSGFVFDTGGTAPTVLITWLGGGSGAGGNNINNKNDGTVVAISSITATQITFSVTAVTENLALNSLTWQNIRVRPTAGTPLASGNITSSGTAAISGVTAGTTNFGTLIEVAGTPSQLAVTTQPSTSASTNTDFGTKPVVAVRDAFGTTVTSDSTTTITRTAVLSTQSCGGTTGSGTLISSPASGTAVTAGVMTYTAMQYSAAESIKLCFTSSGIASAVSNAVTVTDTTAPAAVTNLATGTPTTTSLPLTWTSPGDDGSTGTAASYDVRYSTATITSGNFSSATAATGEPTPSVAGSSESMTIPDLAPNTQYYVAVKAKDEVPNTSGLSNVVNKYTLATVPAAASFGDVTETSVVANWTANSNPAGTEFYVENQTAGTNSGWITATTWTSSSLTAGTAYDFRVKARNGDTTETAWISLSSKSTSGTALTPTPTPTPTTAPTSFPALGIPGATGPTIAAPIIAPAPEAAKIGAPGTTTTDTGIGETVTAVAILPTEGDVTPPLVAITEPPRVIEGNTITFAGTAREEGDIRGVIAGLAHSFDNGVSWHPVTTAQGLGTDQATFTVTTPALPDGTYVVKVRARDNTKNEGIAGDSSVTVDLLPVIFGGLVLLDPSGDAVPTADPTVLAGSSLRIIASFEGGVTAATVSLGPEQFSLTPDSSWRRWSGTIAFTTAGRVDLRLQAQDGAANTFDRSVGVATIVPPLIITDGGKPVTNATVTLERFDANAVIWRDDKSSGQTNPQQTSGDGSVIFSAQRGKFRLRATAPGHWNGVTAAFDLDGPTSFSGTITLPARRWYTYIIPLTTRPLPLPAQDLLTASLSLIATHDARPEILFTDTAGHERTMEEFIGQRVLLTTVAVWNRTSHEQMVVLDQLQNELGKDVVVIPWLIQQPDSVLSSILQRGNYELTGFVDATGSASALLNTTIFPSHFVFDRSGTLRSTRTGFANVNELIELLGDVQ